MNKQEIYSNQLKLKQLKEKDFPKAMEILDNELGKNRVRDNEFLHNKFKKFPEFFIGTFLDKEHFGIICGFPREDYLLISEIAVDSRFQRRGFGKRLVKSFEQVAKNKYNKINVGAKDDAINFYDVLDYKPFLLVQFKEGDYNKKDFNGLIILKITFNSAEIEVKKPNVNKLKQLRAKYPKANFQYIFTKKI